MVIFVSTKKQTDTASSTQDSVICNINKLGSWILPLKNVLFIVKAAAVEMTDQADLLTVLRNIK